MQGGQFLYSKIKIVEHDELHFQMFISNFQIRLFFGDEMARGEVQMQKLQILFRRQCSSCLALIQRSSHSPQVVCKKMQKTRWRPTTPISDYTSIYCQILPLLEEEFVLGTVN